MGITPDPGRSGLATLAAGTVTVAAPAVKAGTQVMLSPQPGAAVIAIVQVSSITPGVGFTLTGLSLLEASTWAWLLVG